MAIDISTCALSPDARIATDRDRRTTRQWGRGLCGPAVRAAEPVLDLADLDDFPSLVVPAMRADPVRQLVLLAVRAFRKVRASESVVGASLVAPRA